MDKPTHEQIKEFWEWCGFTSKIVKRKSADFNGIYYGQDGTFHKLPELYDVELWYEPKMQGLPNEDKWFARNGLPTLDLNNLFRYAVPLTLKKLEEAGALNPLIDLFQRWYDQIVLLAGDSRKTEVADIALFYVCREVIHGD